MWCELQFAVFNRKVPIYGPYLFHLISTTWERLFPQDEFEAPGWIRHESVRLRIKPHWANTTTFAEAARQAVDEEELGREEVAADRSAFSPPSDEPSWAKKLKNKMKRLFCMQVQGQYKAYVAQKESRRREIRILRACGEDVASGSEKHITPKTTWMEKQGYKWSDSEEESVPAAESDDEESFPA